MVGDDVDGGGGAVQVVVPDPEGFEDGEEFLVVDIVVQFGWVEGPRVESDWVYFPIFEFYRKNCR